MPDGLESSRSAFFLVLLRELCDLGANVETVFSRTPDTLMC